MNFIRHIYNSIQRKKTNKHVKSSITQKGSILEVCAGTCVRLVRGSTKEDIIIHDHVMLLGCSLTSSHHGKIEIGNHSLIGQGSVLLSVEKISIGDFTAVTQDVKIVDNNNHPINPEYRRYMRTTPHGSDARSGIHSVHKPIIIGNNCWIGQNSRIQKGVTIGDNSIVAACSVVTKDVPANCIVAGNPAKIVKSDIDKIPAPTSCKDFNEYMANKQKAE